MMCQATDMGRSRLIVLEMVPCRAEFCRITSERSACLRAFRRVCVRTIAVPRSHAICCSSRLLAISSACIIWNSRR